MIKPEQLKVGLIVWWSNDSWSLPWVITKVDNNNNHYRVKTFDTMDETVDLLINRHSGCDNSRLGEMEITTEEKILDYLSKRETSFKNKILETEGRLRSMKYEAELYSNRADILRQELKPKIPEGIMPK